MRFPYIDFFLFICKFVSPLGLELGTFHKSSSFHYHFKGFSYVRLLHDKLPNKVMFLIRNKFYTSMDVTILKVVVHDPLGEGRSKFLHGNIVFLKKKNYMRNNIVNILNKD